MAYFHCDKCHRLVSDSTLMQVQTARSTFSSPAEYEDWCEVCREVPNPRERDDDDGLTYADPRDEREERLR